EARAGRGHDLADPRRGRRRDRVAVGVDQAPAALEQRGRYLLGQLQRAVRRQHGEEDVRRPEGGGQRSRRLRSRFGGAPGAARAAPSHRGQHPVPMLDQGPGQGGGTPEARGAACDEDRSRTPAMLASRLRRYFWGEVRRTLVVILLLLAAEFLLGMAVNLFVNVPTDHPGARPPEYFSGVVQS